MGRVGYLASLLEIILALLLLLTLVLSRVAGVALLVVGVVALLHVLVHDLLHLLHLVHAPLLGGGHPGEAELDLLPALGRVDDRLRDDGGRPGHGSGLADTVVGTSVETEIKQFSSERREGGEEGF